MAKSAHMGPFGTMDYMGPYGAHILNKTKTAKQTSPHGHQTNKPRASPNKQAPTKVTSPHCSALRLLLVILAIVRLHRKLHNRSIRALKKTITHVCKYAHIVLIECVCEPNPMTMFWISYAHRVLMCFEFDMGAVQCLISLCFISYVAVGLCHVR